MTCQTDAHPSFIHDGVREEFRFIEALATRIAEDNALVADALGPDTPDHLDDDIPNTRGRVVPLADRKPLQYVWDDVLELIQDGPPRRDADRSPRPLDLPPRCYVLNRKLTTRSVLDALRAQVIEARELAGLMSDADSTARLENDRDRLIHILEELEALLRVARLATYEDERSRLTPG